MDEGGVDHFLMSMVLQEAPCALLEPLKDQVAFRDDLKDPPLEGPHGTSLEVVESTSIRLLFFLLLLRTLLYPASIWSLHGSSTDFLGLGLCLDPRVKHGFPGLAVHLLPLDGDLSR